MCVCVCVCVCVFKFVLIGLCEVRTPGNTVTHLISEQNVWGEAAQILAGNQKLQGADLCLISCFVTEICD